MSPRPFRLIWYLTTGCSESCLGCPFARQQPAANELSKDQAQSVLRQCIEAGFFAVSYTGGEPTLRSDLLDLLALGQTGNILQFLATNGRQIDRPYAAELKRLGLRGLAFSLDSADARRNDSLRGEGAHSAVLAAAENARTFKIPFSVSHTVDDDSLDEILDIASVAQKIGATGIRIQARTSFSKHGAVRNLTQPGMTKIIEMVRRHSTPDFFSFGCSIGFLRFALSQPISDFSEYGLCDVGPNTLTLRSNGILTTCTQLLPGSENIGNICERSLAEILDTPDQDFSAWLSKGDVHKYKTGQCSNCSALSRCKAGCRGFARLGGDYYASDSACIKEAILGQPRSQSS